MEPFKHLCIAFKAVLNNCFFFIVIDLFVANHPVNHQGMGTSETGNLLVATVTKSLTRNQENEKNALLLVY